MFSVGSFVQVRSNCQNYGIFIIDKIENNFFIVKPVQPSFFANFHNGEFLKFDKDSLINKICNYYYLSPAYISTKDKIKYSLTGSI